MRGDGGYLRCQCMDDFFIFGDHGCGPFVKSFEKSVTHLIVDFCVSLIDVDNRCLLVIGEPREKTFNLQIECSRDVIDEVMKKDMDRCRDLIHLVSPANA